MYSFMKFLKGPPPTNCNYHLSQKIEHCQVSPKLPTMCPAPFTVSSLPLKSTTIPNSVAVTYPVSSLPQHLNKHPQAREPNSAHFLIWCLLRLFNPHIPPPPLFFPYNLLLKNLQSFPQSGFADCIFKMQFTMVQVAGSSGLIPLARLQVFFHQTVYNTCLYLLLACQQPLIFIAYTLEPLMYWGLHNGDILVLFSFVSWNDIKKRFFPPLLLAYLY